ALALRRLQREQGPSARVFLTDRDGPMTPNLAEPHPLRYSGESDGEPMASTRYLPLGPERQSSPRASLSHTETIAGVGKPNAPKFRTIQACPKDWLTLPLAGWIMRQTD